MICEKCGKKEETVLIKKDLLSERKMMKTVITKIEPDIICNTCCQRYQEAQGYIDGKRNIIRWYPSDYHKNITVNVKDIIIILKEYE